jgi:hypothetical protein
LGHLKSLAACLKAYGINVDVESKTGAAELQEYDEIEFDEDEALGGYDVNIYEMPTHFRATPKKRKTCG